VRKRRKIFYYANLILLILGKLLGEKK